MSSVLLAVPVAPARQIPFTKRSCSTTATQTKQIRPLCCANLRHCGVQRTRPILPVVQSSRVPCRRRKHALVHSQPPHTGTSLDTIAHASTSYLGCWLCVCPALNVPATPVIDQAQIGKDTPYRQVVAYGDGTGLCSRFAVQNTFVSVGSGVLAMTKGFTTTACHSPVCAFGSPL